MFKQIKKLFIALVLVFSLCLVACGEDCPECKLPDGMINPDDCPEYGYITKDECPTCSECPTFDTDKECADAGWTKECPETPECPEGVIAPTKIEVVVNSDVTVGENAKVDADVTPANAHKALYWSTSDPEIATVDNEGNVTAHKPGTVTITAVSTLNSSIAGSDTLVVVEAGEDYEIVANEIARLTAQFDKMYVTEEFDLPLPWNSDVKVTYKDADGNEITRFTAVELEEDATSNTVPVTVEVEYGDSTDSVVINVKVVKVAAGYNDFEKVANAMQYVEWSIAEYLDGAKKLEGNITLPTTAAGISVSWKTTKDYVVSEKGVYTRPNNDTAVTLTASFKLGAANSSKEFNLVAKGYTAEEKIKYLTSTGELKPFTSGKFAGTIGLPEKDSKFGIHLTYTSSNEEAITSDGVINSNLTVDTKVKFTVTAVYNDANNPSEAFVTTFDFDVTAASSSQYTDKVHELSDLVDQFKHVAYGMKTNDEGVTYVIDPTTATANNNFAGLTITGSDFIINYVNSSDKSKGIMSIAVSGQYLRYHEANLTVTSGTDSQKVTFVWTVNTGIGAKNDIVYIGGRNNGYQASKNITEHADLLNQLSKWDKYVGVVASTNGRKQNYDNSIYSSFSGYTFYVDVPTGEKEVVFTKDSEGNVTATPSNVNETVRYQYYARDSYTIELEGKTYWVDTDGDGKGDTEYVLPVVVNPEKSVIYGTYGGNYGLFYVNLSDKEFTLPVATHADGSTVFTDGVSVYAQNGVFFTINVSEKEGKTAIPYTDMNGATKIAREHTMALDGFRVGCVLAPAELTTFAEGSSKQYEFVVGTQQGLENSYYSSKYLQSAISSDIDPLWGTTYVTMPAYGVAFSSKTNENLTGKVDGLGGAYITGADMSLPVTVERYYRHAENQRESGIVATAIKSYLSNLVSSTDYTTYTDNGTKSVWKTKTTYITDLAGKITFSDINADVLEEIDALYARYDRLCTSWKNLDETKQAKAILDAIKKAAEQELVSQGIAATLIQKSFTDVKDLLEGIVEKANKMLDGTDQKPAEGEEAARNYTSAEVKTYISNALADANLTAKIESAKLHYATLSEGKKDLYINGFNTNENPVAGSHFSYASYDTAYILEAYELEKNIIALSENVTSVTKVEDYYYELYPEKVKINNKPAGYDPFAGKDLISKYSVDKIELLAEHTCYYLSLDLVRSDIEAAEEDYDNLTVDEQTIVNKTFTSYSNGALGYFTNRINAADAALKKEVLEAAELTSKLVKEITDALKNEDFPTVSEFKRGEFTDADESTLKKLVIDTYKGTKCNYDSKVSKLVSAYMTITRSSARPAKDDNESTYSKVYLETINYLVDGISDSDLDVLVAELGLTDADAIAELKASIKVADFSADGGKDLLTGLFDRYEQYDYYVGVSFRNDAKEFSVNDIAVEDKDQVLALKARWATLTSEQKTFANEGQGENGNFIDKHFNDLLKEIADLENTAKVQYLIDIIDALPSKKEVVLEDRVAIKEVVAKVNAIKGTDLYQYLEGDDTTGFLTDLETKVDGLWEKECERSEAYKLAVEAFEKNAQSENSFNGVVNKDTKAAAEALIAVYDAMNELEQEYFGYVAENADYQELVDMTKSALKVYNKYAQAE